MQAYFCSRCGTVDGLERVVELPFGTQLEIWCIACKSRREEITVKTKLKGVM